MLLRIEVTGLGRDYLAPELPKPWLQEALKAVETIGDKDQLDKALAWLAPLRSESDRTAVAQGESSPSLTTDLVASLPEIRLLAWDIGDERCRFETIRKLIARLPSRVLQELGAAAHRIKDNKPRLLAIARLASLQPEWERLVNAQGVLDAAQAIENEAERAQELARLAPLLPKGERETVVEEALAAALVIHVRDSREEALATLIPWIVKLRGQVEALAMARAMRNAEHRSEALARLAPLFLPESERQRVVQEAMTAALAIQADALVESPLLGSLSISDRGRVAKAWADVRTIEAHARRTRALARLFPLLPQHEQQQVMQDALVSVRTLNDDVNRAKELIRSAPLLATPGPKRGVKTGAERASEDPLLATPGPERGVKTGAERASGDSTRRSEAPLTQGRSSNPEPDTAVQEALAAVVHRLQAIAWLAPLLPKHDRQEGVQLALDIAQDLQVQDSREEALAALVPLLVELRGDVEALTRARAIRNEWHRSEALARLAPLLPEPERQAVVHEALSLARTSIEDTRIVDGSALLGSQSEFDPRRGAHNLSAIMARRSKVLAELADLLPKPEQQMVVQESLAAARAIDEEIRLVGEEQTLVPESLHRSRALTWLAALLPRGRRLVVVQEALAAARVIHVRDSREEALAALIPWLVEQQGLVEALAMARAMRNAEHRSVALARLAREFPESGRQRVVQEAMAAARAITNEAQLVQRLTEVAALLPEKEKMAAVQEALTAARSIGNETRRAEELGALAYVPKQA